MNQQHPGSEHDFCVFTLTDSCLLFFSVSLSNSSFPRIIYDNLSLFLQVFSTVKILFSMDGEIFQTKNSPIKEAPNPEFFPKNRTAFNVVVGLKHRVSRFLKVQLHFKARWILLSEVTFDSSKTFQFSDIYFLSSIFITKIFSQLLRSRYIIFWYTQLILIYLLVHQTFFFNFRSNISTHISSQV